MEMLTVWIGLKEILHVEASCTDGLDDDGDGDII